MKSSKRAEDFRNLSVDDLERREGEMSEQAFRLRFQWKMGQTESLNKMREVRKDRARLLTILHEKKTNG